MVMGCRDVGEKGWEATMFTIDELATIPLFSALGEKSWSTLLAPWRTSTSSLGST